MPNKIELFKVYIDLLDEVYKQGSKTSVLDSDASLLRQTAIAGEFLVPKMEMDGLGEYSRKDGYVEGAVTLDYETKKCNYDRGRVFKINAMDNVETAGIAFGRLSSEFIRTKVVPEIDAFRLAFYAGKAKTKASGSLANGEAWRNAISQASIALDDAEVSETDRFLFITPAGLQLIQDMDTTKSKEVLGRFAGVISVPSTRMFSKIDLYAGKAESPDTDTTKGGYKKNSSGQPINFEIVTRSAIMQYMKNVTNKVISPEENQDDDAWKFFFHPYGIAEAYENKLDGIYVHTVA